MSYNFSPIHSETLVFIGAGATAKLGMPSSADQTQTFRNLLETKNDADVKQQLKDYFSSPDLEKIVAFLGFLDGTEKSNLEVSETDLEKAKIVFGADTNEKLLRTRILELREEYDWNALKKILRICPHNKKNDTLIYDAYSIIDKRLLAGQSLKVQIDESNEEEILSPSRLQGARNFLVIFVNMMFASAWHKIVHNDSAEVTENFEKYRKFINAFDSLMQQEGRRFFDKSYPVYDRSFYMFTTSFVSFNFEMVFPWIFMKSHRDMNNKPPYIQDHPLKLWLDYVCEHRGRKLVVDKNVVPTLEFTETVASRENEEDHVGTPLNRAGKFYFAHGSSNWRECPVCGRMTFYFGHSPNKWEYKSKELIAPFPIPIFDVIDEKSLTEKEAEWRRQLKFDSLQCMHCGSETKASDAPMIMQTMYKNTPTSFLEEIQRNVKVSLVNARHIVLLGYRLPPDDTIWRHAFAESVRCREEKNKAYCSVVVGHKGECRWLCGGELEKYVENHRNADDADDWGICAIENAISIFGLNYVRAWTGGIPQVFGDCAEFDVKQLLYPDWVEWKGTRLYNL